MELGISPLITTGMVINFLTVTKIINYDWAIQQDKRLMEALEKMIGIIIAFT